MQRRTFLATLSSALVACARADAQARPRAPVLVELFTSEGCSSCPPADAELARLESQQPVAGAAIVLLAWHVDYWDYLGWRDPFSSPAATARQRAYSAGGSVYTPQCVVDGRQDLSGVRGAALERAIAEAAATPKANVALELSAGALEVAIDAMPPHGACDVTLVLVQARARVAVAHGENAGRTLDHTSIVRSSVRIGELKSDDKIGRARAKLDSGREVRAVVVVEQRVPRKVVGLSSVVVM